jgi:hypothetical protein
MKEETRMKKPKIADTKQSKEAEKMEKADEGGDQDEKTKIAGTKKSKKAEKIQKAEEKKRNHAITTEKIDEAKTKRPKEAERQDKVEDRSALKGGPIHQEVHEIADDEDFSPEKPDNQLGDPDLYRPTPVEDKSATNAEMVSEKPEAKSQPANPRKAKKEGESPKSRSKQSPLKLAASASRSDGEEEWRSSSKELGSRF